MGSPSEEELRALTDRLVASASYDRALRALEVRTEGGGALRYERVFAIGVTQGARMAGPEWVADTLPQTIFSEHAGGLEKAEAPLGVTWLYGDAADFERSPVRDGLGFTGGRWFRVFVGAKAVEVQK